MAWLGVSAPGQVARLFLSADAQSVGAVVGIRRCGHDLEQVGVERAVQQARNDARVAASREVGDEDSGFREAHVSRFFRGDGCTGIGKGKCAQC